MNASFLTSSIKWVGLIGATVLFNTGCVTKEEKSSYTSDNQSGYMATEVEQMGSALSEVSSSAVAKLTVNADTIYGERIIERLAFKDECLCYVRKATYTGSKGYERERLDTIRLYNAQGILRKGWNLDSVSYILHTRDVEHVKGAKQASVHAEIRIDIKTVNEEKIGVWNGSMTGSYNGEEFKKGSITDVTRSWKNGHFSYPSKGMISLERPIFKFEIDFLGDGKAKSTITNKLNKKVHILYVDRNYQETEAQDQ